MVQFASDGHAMRQPCHLHRKMCEPVSDVVSGGLPVHSRIQGQDYFAHIQVACPLHKKNFSLQDGSCLSGESYSIRTYEVKVDGDDVLVLLPSSELLATTPAIEQRQCASSCFACAPV